jgi:hypothetical protein
VTDHKLHLVVSNQNSVAGVKATLAPKLPPDRTITKISMKMALVSQEGHSNGAAYLVVLTEEGHKHRLWMGPDVNGDPALGYYICDKGSCEDRDPEDLRQYEDLPEKREFPVQAVVTKKAGVRFTVIGHSSETARKDPGPITSFQFELLSNPTKGNFDVTVDDIWITYDG